MFTWSILNHFEENARCVFSTMRKTEKKIVKCKKVLASIPMAYPDGFCKQLVKGVVFLIGSKQYNLSC